MPNKWRETLFSYCLIKPQDGLRHHVINLKDVHLTAELDYRKNKALKLLQSHFFGHAPNEQDFWDTINLENHKKFDDLKKSFDVDKLTRPIDNVLHHICTNDIADVLILTALKASHEPHYEKELVIDVIVDENNIKSLDSFDRAIESMRQLKQLTTEF